MVSLFSPITRGQDIHFSQIDINPILYNPAYSGFFDGTGRFGIAYRNQWASVSAPFQTFAATGEISLHRSRYHRTGYNLGVIAYGDRSGSLDYGITAGQLVLSFFKALNDGKTLFSLGIEGGLGQSGYNVANAQFQEEGDELAQFQVHFPTIGGGMALFLQPSDLCYVKIGLSAHNINRPNISYLSLTDTYLERRFNLYSRAEYRAWANVALSPLLALQVQNKNNELLTGLDVKWFIDESSKEYLTLSGGLTYRLLDAMMINFTCEYNSFVFGLNYDANLSKLTPASHSLGSFEIQIIYRMINRNKIRYRALPCPII